MNRVRLKLDDQVVGYRSGNVLELSNAVGTIKITRQIDKDHYVNLVTGEIHKIHHNPNRASNIKSLKRTFRNIRRLVLSNFKGGDFWLTLTYAQIDHQPMRDTKRVYNDFFRFWRRFKKFCNSSIDYLAVLEPQASGSWHLHCLIKSNEGNLPYMDNNSVIYPMWGQGFTKLKRLRKSDHIAGYLMAYLGDVKVEFTDEDTGETSKKIIKGGRLHFYPENVRIYRRSRGIKDPKKVKGIKGQVLKENGLSPNTEPNYSKYSIIELDNGQKISYVYESYSGIEEAKDETG